MFFRIGVLKSFANFTVKPLCPSHPNKVAGHKACKFTKKRLQHRCFPVKFLRALFYRTSPVAASVFCKDIKSL